MKLLTVIPILTLLIFFVAETATFAKDEAPVEVTMKGGDSPPARAYAKYYRALMAGGVSKVNKVRCS